METRRHTELDEDGHPCRQSAPALSSPPHREASASYWLDTLAVSADASRLHWRNSPPAVVDIAIVGGGLTGTALAYYSRAGADPPSVALLEARSVGSGATGRNGGIMWPCTAEPFELRGAQLIRDFIAARDVSCGFHEAGGVSLVEHGSDGASDDSVLPSVVSVNPVTVLGAETDAFSAAYLEKGVASFCAARVAVEFASAADARGATISEHCRVEKIERRDAEHGEPTVQLVLETGRMLLCRNVVLATNGWLPRLAPELTPHFRACLNTVISSAEPVPVAHRWPISAISCGDGSAEVYASVSDTGVLVLGGLRDTGFEWGGDDDSAPGDECTASALRRWLAKRFPNLAAEIRLDRAWLGVLGFPKDGKPVVGNLPGRPEIWVCGGLCGHGMPRAALLARALADKICGRQPCEENALAEWDVRRFFESIK